MIKYRFVTIDGIKIFYREAGPQTAPALLLLHGFPTSSHMFRDLIPKLASSYRVVAPDLPGFGFSDAPPRGQFPYTFAHLSEVIPRFTETIGLDRFGISSTTVRPSDCVSRSRIRTKSLRSFRRTVTRTRKA
jgi:pimeloyl-ACP methyl ester carboxylesterase